MDAEEKAILAIKKIEGDRFSEDLLNIRNFKITRLRLKGDEFLHNSQYEEAILEYENSLTIIKDINDSLVTRDSEISIKVMSFIII